MNRVEQWSERLADRSTAATWLLMLASFLETIIVPIPIELVLIPYMIAHRDQIWWAAGVVLIGCIAAALVGYGIGALFMQSLGQWAIEAFGWQQDAASFRQWFDEWGFWAIIAVGVVPIPFQVAMLTAGAADYPLMLFCLATVIARGTRYFGLALLVHAFGDTALAIWRAHSKKVGMAALTLILIAVAVIIGYPAA